MFEWAGVAQPRALSVNKAKQIKTLQSKIKQNFAKHNKSKQAKHNKAKQGRSIWRPGEAINRDMSHLFPFCMPNSRKPLHVTPFPSLHPPTPPKPLHVTAKLSNLQGKAIAKQCNAKTSKAIAKQSNAKNSKLLP